MGFRGMRILSANVDPRFLKKELKVLAIKRASLISVPQIKKYQEVLCLPWNSKAVKKCSSMYVSMHTHIIPRAYFNSLNGGTLSGFVPPLKCVPPPILCSDLSFESIICIHPHNISRSRVIGCV